MLMLWVLVLPFAFVLVFAFHLHTDIRVPWVCFQTVTVMVSVVITDTQKGRKCFSVLF